MMYVGFMWQKIGTRGGLLVYAWKCVKFLSNVRIC